MAKPRDCLIAYPARGGDGVEVDRRIDRQMGHLVIAFGRFSSGVNLTRNHSLVHPNAGKARALRISLIKSP